jgi:hypothetical protein
MQDHHLVLEATPKNGRLARLHCLTRQFGRLWCSGISPKHTLFSSLSLIEGIIEPMYGSSLCIKNAEIIDTFATQRSGQDTAKSLTLMRSIIETCVPLGAQVPQTFDLTISLFQDACLFADWKTAPLILGLSFFENEGINLSQFCAANALSNRSQETIEKLAKALPCDLYQLDIEPELLLATLESIGVAKKYQPSV